MANILVRAKVFQDSDQLPLIFLHKIIIIIVMILHLRKLLTYQPQAHGQIWGPPRRKKSSLHVLRISWLDAWATILAQQDWCLWSPVRKAFEQHLTCQTAQGKHDWGWMGGIFEDGFFLLIHLLSELGLFTQRRTFPPDPQPWSFWSRASLSNWSQCTGREQDAELDTPSFNPHPQPWPPWALEQVTCLPKPLRPPHYKECNNTYFLVSLTRLNEIIMLALIYWVLTISQAFGST